MTTERVPDPAGWNRIRELEEALAAEKRWRETRGQLPAEEDKAVKQLMDRVKELEREVDDTGTESLMAGYQQCLEDLGKVTVGLMEVVLVRGPTEGLEYLLQRLDEKEVDVAFPPGMPHDWLSRWKVERA